MQRSDEPDDEREPIHPGVPLEDEEEENARQDDLQQLAHCKRDAERSASPLREPEPQGEEQTFRYEWTDGVGTTLVVMGVTD